MRRRFGKPASPAPRPYSQATLSRLAHTAAGVCPSSRQGNSDCPLPYQAWRRRLQSEEIKSDILVTVQVHASVGHRYPAVPPPFPVLYRCTPSTCALFEFKAAERGRAGIAQLREKGYADKYRCPERSLHLAEFSRAERNVVGLRGRLNGFPFGHFDGRLRERTPPAVRPALRRRPARRLARRRLDSPTGPIMPSRTACVALRS